MRRERNTKIKVKVSHALDEIFFYYYWGCLKFKSYEGRAKIFGLYQHPWSGSEKCIRPPLGDVGECKGESLMWKLRHNLELLSFLHNIYRFNCILRVERKAVLTAHFQNARSSTFMNEYWTFLGRKLKFTVLCGYWALLERKFITHLLSFPCRVSNKSSKLWNISFKNVEYQ